MIKEFFIVFLILSIVFISGCIQPEASESTLEDEAVDQIEQEMEEAVENIDLGDIEADITE